MHRVDYDAIFGDMDVTIPFERYDGKDLIFLGDEAKLLEGDAVGGLNSGVMLIRVSEWSQRFFTEVYVLKGIHTRGCVFMLTLTIPVDYYSRTRSSTRTVGVVWGQVVGLV